jgi:outer membrane cobalamin receptor
VGVAERNTINIVLSNSSIGLNEVIVTALGIRKSVKSITYSVETLKGEELNKAKETNVINTLQGKVAGVTITKNAVGPGR